MKAVEFGADITLKGGAAIENLKAKTMNCTPYASGVANGYDDLPTNPVLGQMFHSSIDDRYYRWGIDRDNDITASLSYRWAPVADVVSEFAFDELSSPTNGVGYYRYNVAANEASVRQAFEDISAIGAAFFDMSSLRTLNLNDFTTPYEIQVIVQQGYTVTQPQIQPYVVNNPYAPRVIRVKNPDNQNPTLYNDTIQVVTGDILLPKYRAEEGSWGYEVIKVRQRQLFSILDLALPKHTNLQSDIDFKTGVNGVTVYNNNGNGNVVLQRMQIPDVPNSSGWGLKFTHSGVASPALGGFYTANVTYPNARFLICFRAKLSTGYNFEFASNMYGNEGAYTWVTPKDGTGNWEDYMCLVQAGTTGSFSSTNFYYVNGAGTSIANPLVWYLGSVQVYDLTEDNLPKMTTAQINAIVAPQSGWKVYNTTQNTMCFYNGSSWQKVTSTAM